ncbi:uncharacterized protein [Lepeophtheirus salmonis]|uniref:uncharacterized protein n=1 Tax=Lepeophtheirus salmonis TaxID=72036 RepID=UPI001AE4119E|nr:uncharacterized protein LOC121121856 [Lepeophtheirus salmonis]XP_040572787.1 uncharacterized protein LOC121121856 [Lepeophtheirus salmonis]
MRLYLTLKECMDLSDSILVASQDSLTQKAVIFCIMDPRPYAPPLESNIQDRLIHLRRSSELKLNIPPSLTESLIQHGFMSLTLLSLISDKHLRILGRLLRLDPPTIEKLKGSIEKLNEAPLEPLYSYKKYLVVRRKNKKASNRRKFLMDYLHLDEPRKHTKLKPTPPLPIKESPLPPTPTPTPSPPLPRPKDEEDEETTSTSSSSLFSYGSPHIPVGIYGFCPLFFCPRHSTPTEFPSLFRHIFEAHNPFRAQVKDFNYSSRNYGSVELEFSLGEAMRVRADSVLWFGPTEFLFDGVPFYEIVYRIPSPRKKGIKKLDVEGTGMTNCYIFWLYVGAGVKTAEKYSYVISLYKDKEHRNAQRRSVTSFESNPIAMNHRDDQSRGPAGSASYFTFEENKLKNIAFSDGTLKYFVKIFKNRLGNNNSYSSSQLSDNNYYTTKQRHNY